MTTERLLLSIVAQLGIIVFLLGFIAARLAIKR
jgi:hypothetical protein